MYILLIVHRSQKIVCNIKILYIAWLLWLTFTTGGIAPNIDKIKKFLVYLIFPASIVLWPVRRTHIQNIGANWLQCEVKFTDNSFVESGARTLDVQQRHMPGSDALSKWATVSLLTLCSYEVTDFCLGPRCRHKGHPSS